MAFWAPLPSRVLAGASVEEGAHVGADAADLVKRVKRLEEANKRLEDKNKRLEDEKAVLTEQLSRSDGDLREVLHKATALVASAKLWVTNIPDGLLGS